MTDPLSIAREALEWYAEQVGSCRKNTSEGDTARQQLDKDAGKRAEEALAALSAQPLAREDAADAEVEKILAMSDKEIFALAIVEGIDPEMEAARLRKMFEGVVKNVKLRTAREEPGLREALEKHLRRLDEIAQLLINEPFCASLAYAERAGVEQEIIRLVRIIFSTAATNPE